MWKEMLTRLGCQLVSTMVLLALATVVAAAADAADSEAARVAADTVRAHGFPCTEPVSAERESTAGKADEATWILVCSDARYRVRFMGEMPAKVERLK